MYGRNLLTKIMRGGNGGLIADTTSEPPTIGMPLDMQLGS
jgi:hypothetical protein